MRSANGYTGAVDAATAITRGDLGPAAANANLTNDDYWSCDAAGALPAPTTPDAGDFLNAIVEEFKYILDMGSVGHAAPWAFDPTSNSQLAQVLAGAPGIHSAVDDTGFITTRRTRAIIAGYGQATGDNSVVIASNGAYPFDPLAAGAQSFVAAVLGQHQANGDQSFIIGANSGIRNTYVDGDNSGILAVSGLNEIDDVGGFLGSGSMIIAGGSGARVTGGASLMAACDGAGAVANEMYISSASNACAILASTGNAATPSRTYIDTSLQSGIFGCGNGCVVANSSFSTVLSSGSGVISDAVEGFIGASIGCYVGAAGGAVTEASAVLASRDSGVTGHHSAVFACDDVIVTSDDAAAIACNGVTSSVVDLPSSLMVASDGAVPSPSDGVGTGTSTKSQLYGGTGGARNWRIDAENGGIGYFTGGAVTGGADFAEFFPAIGGEAGIGRIVTRRRTGSRIANEGDTVLGVCSAAPGFTGNSGGETAARSHGNDWSCVALTGQVPVKVDATISNEAIDAAESGGCELYIKAMDGGIGGASAMPSRIVAMEMIEDGLCMCLIR